MHTEYLKVAVSSLLLATCHFLGCLLEVVEGLLALVLGIFNHTQSSIARELSTPADKCCVLQRARGDLPALDLARHARVRQLGVGNDDAVCDEVIKVLRGGIFLSAGHICIS